MRRAFVTGIGMLAIMVVVIGLGYPLLVTGISAAAFGHKAGGSLMHDKAGKLIGSQLLGQSFADAKGNPMPKYFQPRPSDAGSGYDATSSGASNLGPNNPLLVGFVAGVNTVGTDGAPSKSNPFATPADPSCVPMDKQGNPVTAPAPGQQYAKNADGTYVCDPNTLPERAMAYRRFNEMAPGSPVPIDAVTASGSGLDPNISIANAMDQAARVARIRHLARSTVVALVRRDTTGRQFGFLGEPRVNVVDLNLALDRLS